MKQLPNKLQSKLKIRKANNALRKLNTQNNLTDFSSNDYLGFSKFQVIFDNTHQYLIDNNLTQNGSTGSRLLSGNHELYNTVETMLCEFHNSEAALIFNSGYDANVGFFSSVPQRGDIILYDEYIHASIRDGIKISNAKAYKFKHNDLDNLDKMLKRTSTDSVPVKHDEEVYIVTESVFSMDGDTPDLVLISEICKNHNAHLIIDEAHALGVFGENGLGLIQGLGIENAVFARLFTFGKGLGCHGAAILGSNILKQYLVNFARSFIYTTALPPHSLATIKKAYEQLVISNKSEKSHFAIQQLNENILFFKSKIEDLNLQHYFIKSESAIHCCIISGNKKVKSIANQFKDKGFDVKSILSPTVPKGRERLRFCLHSYNSETEISKVLELLATFV